jgi:hypothetical protein
MAGHLRDLAVRRLKDQRDERTRAVNLGTRAAP